MIRRALLSAWDKSGLVEFAQGLQDLGVDLVASGGTAEHLAESGIHATPVEELTEIPEMKDPLMTQQDDPMPFDMKRMAYGGFKVIVDA